MAQLSDRTLYQRTFGNHYLVIAVTACLILILMGLLSERLEREVSRVEQAHYEQRLRELQAVVRLMEAALRSQGEMSLANRFEGSNPMDWLQEDSSNYLGARSPEEALKHPGNWFFDAHAREIAYIPTDINAGKDRSAEHKIREKILRFKVLALRSNEDRQKFIGLVLSPVTTNPDN